MSFSSYLNGVSTLAIVCTQWGDTGKGKFVDFFAQWADIIARGTGGANAGHTIRIGSKTYTFHLIPSGILHDDGGKKNIVGSGVAFDPRIFCEELTILRNEGMSYEHLLVALNARLVLPQHLLIDRLNESSSSGKIGTTGRGIGPTYVDHVDRIGLVVNDLLNPDCFARKLERNLSKKRGLLAQQDPERVREILHHEHLGGGAFYHPTKFLDKDAIVERYCHYGRGIKEMIADTDTYLTNSVGKRKILLEGAQGNLLSIDYGTYPYVTSSDCSMQGLARGVGLRDRQIDRTLGIVKAFYMTRVGEGPFPTELGGEQSAKWCNATGTSENIEREKYPYASVNSVDQFQQGIGIRWAGNEYGATTKRPRRVGWLDLPLLRYSKRHTGPDTILTKLDVLDECETIMICTSYRYMGPTHHIGGRKTLQRGKRLFDAVPDYDVIQHCIPLYRSFEGWLTPTSGCRHASEIPLQLQKLVCFIAKEAGLNIVMLSVGPDREQTVVVT